MHRDWVYIIGILIILFGFGVLAVFAFIMPVTNLSQIDGKCRIDLPLVITIPQLRLMIDSNTHLANPSITTTTLGLAHYLQSRKPDCPSLVRSPQYPVTLPVRISTMSASIDSSNIHGKDYPQGVPVETGFGPEKWCTEARDTTSRRLIHTCSS